MPIDTEQLREHVDAVRDDEAKKVVVRAAIERHDALRGVTDPSAEQIAPIVEAANSRFTLVWSIATDLLLDLADRSPVALDALLRMVAADSWQQRLHLIASLDGRVSTDLATELVRLVIHDRSSRVRTKAAEKIERLELDLVDELRQMVVDETHGVAKRSLERSLQLATIGYEVEHEEDGRVRVLARTRPGWVGFTMTNDEVARGELPQRVAEIRRQYERTVS